MKKIGIAEPSYGDEEMNAVLDVLRSGRLKQGPRVQDFEDMFSSCMGMKYGVAVNSGSSANLLVFEVLKAAGHLLPGDEVLTSALTWPTTIHPIVQVGCTPVFLDSDPKTLSIDPIQIEKSITEKTKAIIVIHYCGYPCDMDRIVDIARDNDLVLIEDCAQSHGAEYKGRKVGSFGDFSTFSFATTHGMTAGEGGMVLTNNISYDRLARSIREFGRFCSCKTCAVSVEGLDKCPYGKPSQLRFTWSRLGYSFRMTEMQAAFGIVQLKRLNSFNQTRRENAQYLTNKISRFADWLYLPVAHTQPERSAAWIVYPLVINRSSSVTRDSLMSFLESQNIEARILFPSLLNHPVIKCFQFKVSGELEATKWVDDCGLMIGCHPSLTTEDLDRVVNALKTFSKCHEISNG